MPPVTFDDLENDKKKPITFDDIGPSLKGKSFSDLSPQDLSSIRSGISNQVGAAITGMADARSFGLGDEIGSAIGAPAGWAASQISGSNKSLGDIYNQNLANYRKGMVEKQEDYPGAFVSGQLLGGFKSAKDVAKAAPQIGQWLRSGGTLRQLGKEALLGGASVGGYMAASGEGAEDRGQRLMEGLAIGSVLGPALHLTGDAISGVRGAVRKNPPPPPASTIRKNASEAFDYAREQGANFAPHETDTFLNGAIESVLPKDEFVLNMSATQNSPAVQFLKELEPLRGRPMTLDRLEAIDKKLTKEINKHVNPLNGNLLDEGNDLFEIQSHLRDMAKASDQPGTEIRNQAMQLWSQQAQMQDIENIVSRSLRMANPAASMKSGLNTLLSSPRRTRGYDPETLQIIEKAATHGTVDDILGILGSRLTSIGSLFAGGGVAGDIAGQIGTAAARHSRTALQLKNAQKIQNSIASKVQPFERPPEVVEVNGPQLALPAPTYEVSPSGIATTAEREILGRGYNPPNPTIEDLSQMPPEQALAIMNSYMKRYPR